MKHQLSFLHNGERFVTLFGASEYLASFLMEGSNVASYNSLIQSGGANAALKKEFGITMRTLLLMDTTDVQIVDGKYLVKGKVTIDGTEHVCEITADSLIIQGIADAEEEKVETAKEDVKAEAAVTETVTEVTPVEVPEVPAEPVKENVEEKPQELPPVEELVTEVEEVVEETSETENFDIPEFVVVEPNANDLRDMKTTSGITFCGIRPGTIEEMFIGQPPATVHGISFENTLLRAQKREQEQRYKARNFIKEEVEEVKPVAQKPEPKPVPVPKHESKQMEELPKEEEPVMAIEIKNVADADIPVASNKEKELEEFKKTLDPEVVKVLKQIPHKLLGDITEFTTRPIDVETLKDRGYGYCVDNRWCHSGSWYCIDVVSDTARHYYNRRLDINIAIPISTIRQYFKLTEKDEMYG